MGWFKDLTVMATSMVPVAGPLLGGVVDGVWTGVETGSFTDGLKAGALTTGLSLIPGGKILKETGVGSLIGRTLFSKGPGAKLVGLVGKAAAKGSGKIATNLANRSTKGLQNAAGRMVGRGAAGFLSSHYYNPGADNGQPKLPKVLPTRPAGKENRYAGSTSTDTGAVIGA
ncbi:hypothetical protein [Nocardia spumae]|uniref:hypothetical protein n=1 Tax=Nocardia spumae TaxID=2887190 RepID=UPI001D148325|nr:hypothetical protein [Nocardia spumae]